MIDLSVFVLLLAVPPTLAVAGPTAAGPGGAGQTVAVKLVESHIYVPATVGGQERLWILDCGAGGSVIDRGFAQELGLATSGDVQAVGAAGSVQTGFATVPQIRVGEVEVDSLPMVVLDVAAMMRSVVGTEPAGILGYDFISRFVTRVDFAGRTVTFFRPEVFSYAGAGKRIPMRLASNIPTVEMAVDNVGTGWWRLDIGASVSTFHHQSVRQHRLSELPGVSRVARGVGGRQRVNWVRLGHAELAGYRVEKPLFSVPLEGGGGALASSDVVGTLGNSVLRNFSLYLDYGKRYVIVEKGADFGSTYTYDRSGLQVELADSGRYEVICAAANTPADRAGFRVGDIVSGVNGRSVDDLGGLVALRELLRAAPGTSYDFSVARGDSTRQMRLVLKDLFAD